jgi:hypothetical protein
MRLLQRINERLIESCAVSKSGMRAIFCLIVLAAVPPSAIANRGRRPPSFSDEVKAFLSLTDTPLLFIGRVTWVNSSYLPCTIQNSRTTSWAVSKVLYGFDPGKKVDARFGSCGLVEPQFKSSGDMLVIAYPGPRNVWYGMKESVVPATDANTRAARNALDGYLREQIRRLIQPGRGGKFREILVFTGTILDPGPQRDPDLGCPSGVPPAFPVKFGVDQVLRGNWTGQAITVQFLRCGPLRDPPYRSGLQVLVLALPLEPSPAKFFRAGFLLPPEQQEEAISALRAIEASHGANARPKR